MEEAQRKGYRGVDVDFEYVYGEDATAYAAFLSRLREALAPKGLPLSVALAAKTRDGQPGRLYEGHDYGLIAKAVDYALLMTYDWGYVSGPPMAVAPLPQVREVVAYALTHFWHWSMAFTGWATGIWTVPSPRTGWCLPPRPTRQPCCKLRKGLDFPDGV